MAGPKKMAVATYLLLVLRGLEFLAVEEIRATLDVVHLEVCSVLPDPKRRGIDVMQGDAAVGKIVLQTRSTPDQVKKLRSVQALLAFLAKSDEIVTDDARGVDQIAEMVMKSDWDSAMALWKAHSLTPTDAPTFRGSCVRDGRHSFKSVEVAGEIGARVVEKFGWDVDLTEFQLEIVCVLFHNHMVAGLSLTDPTKSQFRSRLAHEDRSAMFDSDYTSTLRPSTAFLMLQLARYNDGDIICDSMCGVGTIPVCIADYTENAVFALGGELDALPVSKAGLNAASLTGGPDQRSRHVNVCQWDSTRLPLRDGCIDIFVVDMPFGVRCGNHRLNSKIYPKVMKELYRVLRPGGLAVMLAMSKKLFLASIRDRKFQLVNSYDVNIGGLCGGIYVLRKPCQ